MSPEQARGEALDHRSDLYSLGATFYRLLAGEPPFSGETSRAVMEKQVFEKPRPVREINSTVPKVLAGICARLLEKDPAARYQSATDLIEDLEDAREEIEGEPDFPVVEAPPLRARGTRREPRVRPRAPRRNWVELIGVCAGVLMLLGLVYLLVDYMGRGERAFRQGLVLKEQGKLVESEKALERALALAGGGSLASQIRRHLEEVKEKIVSVQETARVQKVVERAKARAAAGGAELARAINALEAEVDSSWVGRDIASGPLAEFQGRLRDEAAAELAARKDKAEAFLAEGALADAFGVYDEFPAHYEGTSAFGEARRAAGEVRSRGATQYLATARKVETLLDEGRLRPEAFAEAQKLLGPFAFRSGVPDISSDAQRMLDEVKRAVDASEEDKRAEDARRRIARVEGLVRRGRVLARRYHYDEANRATREAQNALRALGRHDRLAELDAYVGSIGRQRQLFDALVRWLREGAVVAETIVLPGGARVRVTGVRPADMDFYIRTEGGEDRRLPWDQLPPSEVLKLYGAMPSEPYWQLLAVEFCLEHGLVREARGLMAAVRRVRPEDKARAEALAARAEAADPDRRPDEQDAETLAAWASEAAGQGKPDEARGLIELLRTRYALTQAASADRLEEIEAAVRRGGG